MRAELITANDYNDEEIRAVKYLDGFELWVIALFFVCIVGQCSAEQLFRWLLEFESNENKCLKAISDLRGRNLINKLRRDALKTLGLWDEIIIYFATELAREEMQKRVDLPAVVGHPGLMRMEQFVFGEPTKHRLYRVWHQLLCAESILSFLIKHYFCWFRSERQLQAKKRRKNDSALKTYKNDTTKPKPYINYKTGDYKIHLLNKNTSDRAKYECEITHELTFKQIQQKPPGLTYFCFDDEEATLVKRAAQTDNVTVLTSDLIFEPGFVRRRLSEEFYSKNTKTSSQQQILELIHYLGGIVTATLIALHCLQKDDYCRAKLEQLYEQGYLNKVKSCLKPGTSRGRNINFYCLNYIYTEDDFIFRSGILRCYALMTKLKEFEYTGYIYAVDGGVVTYRNEPHLLVSDNENETPDENLERFYQIRLDYPEFKLSVIGIENWRLLIYKTQKIGFVSLSDLNESKSYREKPNVK
jgi:hypothetical protein